MKHPTTLVRRYGSIEDAAAYYKVSKKTVRRWIDEGLIAGYRVGPRYIRLDMDELEAAVVREIPSAGGDHAS